MKLSRYTALPFLLLTLPSFAARPVDLSHQKISFLNSLSFIDTAGIKEVSQSKDFNQTTHIRIKETYAGYPVWNGNGVVHIPKHASANLKSLLQTNVNDGATMNGTVYKDLATDLRETPSVIFEPVQADKALEEALFNFQKKTPINSIENKKTQLMVYVDDDNKAHWVFHVSFYAEQGDNAFEPNYLLDAATFKVYQQWDNIKTLEDVKGGGIGGNPKMGKLVYDGAPGNLAALDIQRDDYSGTCYLQNETVKLFDYKNRKPFYFPCYSLDRKHNMVYWNNSNDRVNGGYSPNNDSLYAGNMLQVMYKDLYGVDVLKTQHDKPMVLKIYTHAKIENAQWRDGMNVMVIGDGEDIFYPLASVGVIAHEVSHGFTHQHSDLQYIGRSGGINEAFSDMASQVVEKYAFGKNSWQIGPEIAKENMALRYMDRPSKDCDLRQDPDDQCSIDSAKDYRFGLDVHYSSGVFNRAFYLLATTPDWDVYKAFGVMLQANSNYWTPTSNFHEAACGVVEAAKDFKYDIEAVKKVFYKVGINTSNC